VLTPGTRSTDPEDPPRRVRAPARVRETAYPYGHTGPVRTMVPGYRDVRGITTPADPDFQAVCGACDGRELSGRGRGEARSAGEAAYS